MVIGLYSVKCMCTFKVSNKPNVLNLRYKFCPSPPRSSDGGGQQNVAPPTFISVHALSIFLSLHVFLSTFLSVHVLPLYIPLCTCPSFLHSSLCMSFLSTFLSVHVLPFYLPVCTCPCSLPSCLYIPSLPLPIKIDQIMLLGFQRT